MTMMSTKCPGRFMKWSAFGATYPDTVCATALEWPDGAFPGLVLCDLDDDGRARGEIPCPFCDPNGFNEYEGDDRAAAAVQRLERLEGE